MRGFGRLLVGWAFLSGAWAATPHEEIIFERAVNASGAMGSLWKYTREPRVHGSPGDLEAAEWTLMQFKNFGLNASIEKVDVEVGWPNKRPSFVLETPGPEGGEVTLKLLEDRLPQDREDNTSDPHLRDLPWHSYSPSGDVKGRVIYANYGTRADFQSLAEMQVDVRGSIVMVRYGYGGPDGKLMSPSVKVRNAHDAGAKGVLLFSDPMEDGATIGTVWPEGPWRPSSSIQRHTVLASHLCPGDPTRSYRYKSEVEDICGFEIGELLPKIPSLPISSEDALLVLEQLKGKGVPLTNFQGGLAIPYWSGPSSGEGQLVVQNLQQTAPIANVIVTIPGKLGPNYRPIVLGSARDAWVYGAVKSSSGSAALIEVAKGLAAMLHAGWRPFRTIYLASWSGEEPGSLGATAWAEQHAGELEDAVAYLNVGAAVSGGHFRAQATPSLFPLIRELTWNVHDPVTGKPLANLAVLLDPLEPVGAHQVFSNHLGIASADIRFEGAYGVSNSVYDSFGWFDQNVDHRYLATAAVFWGLMGIRLADALVLPLDPRETSYVARAHFNDLKKLGLEKSCNKAAHEDAFASLEGSINTFQTRAFTAMTHRSEVLREIDQGIILGTFTMEEALSRPETISMNDRLAYFERRLLMHPQVIRRPWYRHAMQAPDTEWGFSLLTFPGPTEPLQGGHCDQAVNEIHKLVVTFFEVSEWLVLPVPPRPTPAPPGPLDPHHVTTLEATVVVLFFVSLCIVSAKTVVCHQPRAAALHQQALHARSGVAGPSLGPASDGLRTSMIAGGRGFGPS